MNNTELFFLSVLTRSERTSSELFFLSMLTRSERTSSEQPRAMADEWELPHSAVKVGRVLGTGAFGQVLLGRVSRALLRHRGLPLKYSTPDGEGGGSDGDPLMTPVAIKMLKGWWCG